MIRGDRVGQIQALYLPGSWGLRAFRKDKPSTAMARILGWSQSFFADELKAEYDAPIHGWVLVYWRGLAYGIYRGNGQRLVSWVPKDLRIPKDLIYNADE